MRQIIKTDKAPAAIGPYNQGIVANGTFLFTAGQIPLNPETGEIVGENVTSQARCALDNVKAVVESAGSSMAKVVKVTVFLQSMDDFAAMNDVYKEYFDQSPPARSAVEVSKLPKGVLVEIEAIALVI